jgi:D-proline reductase (dithiol) PrdB
MCHQTVGLVQAVIEARGIATASLTVMPRITARVAPPRALIVDAPLGAPLGRPHDVAGHRERLGQLLALLARTDVPVLARPDDAEPAGRRRARD